MEPVSIAIIGGVGWIGVLARSYYTEMLKIAVDRAARQEKNEEDRVTRERQQFDIIFQNLLTRVNEERDIIQSLIEEVKRAIDRSSEMDREVSMEVKKLREILISFMPTQRDGLERRK